jgi:hypothetical protein
MPRGKYVRTPKADKTDLVISTNTLTGLPWWSKISIQEQSAVMEETQLLAGSLLDVGKARLKVGEHLTKLQGILEPHNLFSRYLKTFHFSRKTAYRYIAGFKNAQATLPGPILVEAMKRNIDIIGYDEVKPLGKYTDAVKALPPPNSATSEQASTYLDALEDTRKKVKSTNGNNVTEFAPVSDPNALTKEMFRFCDIRLRRISHHKQKQSVIHKLFGMLLASQGIANPLTIAPQAAPEDYKTQRGRPVLVASA